MQNDWSGVCCMSRALSHAVTLTLIHNGNKFRARCHAGEKLSESTAADVRELCSTLLNCYLIQVPFCLNFKPLSNISCQSDFMIVTLNAA